MKIFFHLNHENNVYCSTFMTKVNIYHIIKLMIRINLNDKIPVSFDNKFEIVHYHNTTKHSETNFMEPKI